MTRSVFANQASAQELVRKNKILPLRLPKQVGARKMNFY